jgi:hypothetical protein
MESTPSGVYATRRHPVHTSVIARGLTIAGVAIGSALLIGALALAMRGLAPVASNAAAKPAMTLHTLRALNRPAHNLVKRLAAWHAPRVPKVHRHPVKPVVVTVTAPPTVIPAPQPVATATAAAPASTGSSGGYGQDDGSGSGDD